jgi:chemotaxis protein MotB
LDQGVKMKNIAIIALSVVLAAAIIFCLIFYPQYLDTKDALSTSEKKLVTLKEENSAMKDQIQNYADSSRELEKVKVHISELTNTVKIKDQSLSEFEEKLGTLENAFEEKKKAEEILKEELSAKDVMIADLQEKLKTFQSSLRYIKDIIEKGKSAPDDTVTVKDQTLSELEEKLGHLVSDFEEKKEAEETLKGELSSKDEMVTELQKELKTSQSYLVNIEDEIARRKSEIERLRLKLLDLTGEKTLAVTKLGTLKSTYDALISDLKKQIEKQEVTIKAYKEKISVSFVDRILFEFGKATISYKGKKILRKVGGILKDIEDKQIRIIGHTDNIPILPRFRHKFPSNWELSAARAAAVVRYFENTMELDPTKLEAVGRSYYEPIASNETKEGRAQNRRVNIIIAPKIE